jgi:hypothetical protein
MGAYRTHNLRQQTVDSVFRQRLCVKRAIFVSLTFVFCGCVCVRERERERERASGWVDGWIRGSEREEMTECCREWYNEELHN